MDEMPHLNASGTSFFNGTDWALLTKHHWNDGVPSWTFAFVATCATVAAFIALTILFAPS